MDLNIDTVKRDGSVVVSVAGEVDVFTAPKLRVQLNALVEQGERNIIVGLEGVDFLDSFGLGVLVAGLKRVKTHDGNLSIVCTQERILKIFRITGLTKVFPIHASVEESISAAGKVADGA